MDAFEWIEPNYTCPNRALAFIAVQLLFLEMCLDYSMYHRSHRSLFVKGYLFQLLLFHVGDKGYNSMGTGQIT